MQTAARAFVSDSLGFHLFFVLIGIGLPVMISLFEFIAIRRQDEALREQIRKWVLATIIFAIAGVISGTLIAVQFSLIWPQFMAFTSQVVGPAFMFEGYFFLLEAVFLAFYVASWGRIKGYAHWLISLGTVVGALGSAVVITLVNAWMNNPIGFEMVGSTITHVSLPTALFSLTGLFTVVHSVLSYITVVALSMAGIYAVLRRRATLRTKKNEYGRYATWFSIVGIVFIIGTMLWGHASAQYLASSNPNKLAAYELQVDTQSNAPLRVGGYYNESTKKVEGAIELPGLLSFLAGNSFGTTVTGLNETPHDKWPPLVVHTLFDIKMALAILALAIPAVVIISRMKMICSRLLWLPELSLRALPYAGIAAFLVVELGWFMAELGRQPYAIRGYLLTADAFAKDPAVVQIGIIFPILFVLLLASTLFSLFIALKRKKSIKESI